MTTDPVTKSSAEKALDDARTRLLWMLRDDVPVRDARDAMHALEDAARQDSGIAARDLAAIERNPPDEVATVTERMYGWTRAFQRIRDLSDSGTAAPIRLEPQPGDFVTDPVESDSAMFRVPDSGTAVRGEPGRDAVHAAIERIVENELTGVPSWRYGLTDRLTDAALAARSTALPPATGEGLRAVDGCIAIIEQSLATVRAEAGDLPSGKAGIAAREGIIELLRGYRAALASEPGSASSPRDSDG